MHHLVEVRDDFGAGGQLEQPGIAPVPVHCAAAQGPGVYAIERRGLMQPDVRVGASPVPSRLTVAVDDGERRA